MGCFSKCLRLQGSSRRNAIMTQNTCSSKGSASASPEPAIRHESPPGSFSSVSQEALLDDLTVMHTQCTITEKKRKQMDRNPKFKKLKYHQYVPPNQKLMSQPLRQDYSKLLHLQLHIKRAPHYYATILPASSRPETDQHTTSATVPNQPAHQLTSDINMGLYPPPLPTNLEKLKVVQLKLELKRLGLIRSGTKHSLIQRLKLFHQDHWGRALPVTSYKPQQESGNQSEEMTLQMANQREEEVQSPISHLNPKQTTVLTSSEHLLADWRRDERSLDANSTESPSCGHLTHCTAQCHSHQSENQQTLEEKDRQISELKLMLQERHQLVKKLRSRLQEHETEVLGMQPQQISMMLKVESRREGPKSKHTHNERKKSSKKQKITEIQLPLHETPPTATNDVNLQQQRIYKQPIRKTLKPEKNNHKTRPSLSALTFFDSVDSALTRCSSDKNFLKNTGEMTPLIRHAIQTPTPAAPPFSQASSKQRTSTQTELKNGCLEDFLESTTGKPLFGVEPGGHVTLIDELHSQLLSTPSILNPPSLPMDPYDLSLTSNSHGVLDIAESGLDSIDWLELKVGGATDALSANKEPSSSVFSADFLTDSDLQLHFDTCLLNM